MLLNMQINYMKLLICLVHNGSFGQASNKSLLQLNKKIPLTNLFEEIIFNLNILIERFKGPEKKKLSKNAKLSDDIVDKLVNLYIGDMDFEESLELGYCLHIFKYISI